MISSAPGSRTPPPLGNRLGHLGYFAKPPMGVIRKPTHITGRPFLRRTGANRQGHRSVPARRYRPGATPNRRLNAVPKANVEVYPTLAATASSAVSPARSSLAAVVIRHQVR